MMEAAEIARRLKGHRATHPMAHLPLLENLVTHVLELRGNTMEPTIGRIVIITVLEAFVNLRQYPAIITKVINETTINATIFGSGSPASSKTNVTLGDGTKANTWVWPTQV